MTDPRSYPQDEGPFAADWDGLAEESGEENGAEPEGEADAPSDEEERVDPLASARRGRYDDFREVDGK